MLVFVFCLVLLASSEARKPKHDHTIQIAACNQAPSDPEDRRPNKKILRVGTYNAEWLFLNRWEKRWTSFQQALEHLHLIARVIRELNYDVLNLVEVESCEVLLELINAIGDPSYRAYLLPGTDTATGQNVALLTRVDPIEDLWRTSGRAPYPVPGSTCGYDTSGDYGVSKHYFTRIRPENFPQIFIAGLHFLAFPDRVSSHFFTSNMHRKIVALKEKLKHPLSVTS